MQVLLVEADRRTREKVHKQLSQLSYVGMCERCCSFLSTFRNLREIFPCVQSSTIEHMPPPDCELLGAGTCCTDTSEAAKVLASRPNHFDLVLAEVLSVCGTCVDLHYCSSTLKCTRSGPSSRGREPCVRDSTERAAVGTDVRGWQCY